MRRVFDGGAGDESGGSVDRSRDIGDRDRFLEIEDGEDGGEGVRLVLMGAGCARVGEAMFANGTVGWDVSRVMRSTWTLDRSFATGRYIISGWR